MARPVAAYERAASVTKSDTTIVDCEGFFFADATAANVAIVPKRGGSAVTLTNCQPGTIYPIACQKIMSTNTTAAVIIALY